MCSTHDTRIDRLTQITDRHPRGINKGRSMRIILACLLLLTPLLAMAQRTVAPMAGRWDYGNDRCSLPQYGYPSESAALEAGINRFYGSCPGASPSPQSGWGTTSAPTAACSSASYPYFKYGVEYLNVRPYIVDFYYGQQCDTRSADGLSIFRQRSVACPSGYTYTSSKTCVRQASAVDPQKNCNNCNAGSNGSNPIQPRWV